MQHGSENSVLSHAVVGPDGKAKSAGGRNRDQGLFVATPRWMEQGCKKILFSLFSTSYPCVYSG